MTDTLRERVARAIDQSLCNARVTSNNLFYLPEADAAIALVLEEAARTAEAFPARTHGNLATAPYAAAEQAADEIAAAIRALKEDSNANKA